MWIQSHSVISNWSIASPLSWSSGSLRNRTASIVSLVFGTPAHPPTIRTRNDSSKKFFISAQRKGPRREPAADDVRFVSERIGWLPFAAPS